MDRGCCGIGCLLKYLCLCRSNMNVKVVWMDVIGCISDTRIENVGVEEIEDTNLPRPP